MERLTNPEWTILRREHLAKVRPWTKDRVLRSQHGQKHPVYDFLFDYYSFRPAHLERWSAGADVFCERMTASDWPSHSHTIEGETGMVIPSKSFPSKLRTHLEWGVEFLQTTIAREANFSCFGLHEWAMVYQAENIRHGQIPLRLSTTETNSVVESLALRCTHFDAFRFFTPEAIPLNKQPLTRLNQIETDQPGCIHANMDLYKLAFRISPFVSSRLLVECFELACEARIIDMRASPYDLLNMGFTPICIETKEGRDKYVVEQKRLAELAKPLRSQLLDVYRNILAALKQPIESGTNL
jgi:hypothetical protein